jgi:hypothetical protein
MFSSIDQWPALIAGRRTVVDNSKQHILYEFDTFQDFVTQSAVPTLWREKQSRTNGHDFTDTKTFEEAVELARHGWDEGTKRIHKSIKDIELVSNMQQATPVQEYDVAGSYPNVPMFCAGEEYHMAVVSEEDMLKRTHVEIIVNGTVSGSTPKEHIANFGAALVAYVDRLEDAGVRVGVRVHYTVSSGNRFFQSIVRVKEPEGAIALPVLAFAIIHPSSLRRLAFGMIEQVYFPNWDNLLCHGYGCPNSKIIGKIEEDTWVFDQLNNWGSWDNAKKSLDSMERQFIEMAKKHNQETVSAIMARS